MLIFKVLLWLGSSITGELYEIELTCGRKLAKALQGNFNS